MLNPIQASRLGTVINDDVERLTRIERAWTHYEGTAAEVLQIAADGSNDNIRIFSGENIVDKGAAFLFNGPGGVQLQTEETAAAGKIGEAWPEDQRAIHLFDMAVNGGVTGHVLVRLRKDGQVIVLDPSSVTPHWNPTDITTIEKWVIEVIAVDPDANLPYIHRTTIEQDGEHWHITDEKSVDSGHTWAHVADEPWEYPWAPIRHGQNRPNPNQFWGRPDLTDGVLDLTESIWAILGYMRRLVRHSGHPIPWATGTPSNELAHLDLAIGNMLASPKVEARFGQLEATGDLGAAREFFHDLKDEWRELTAMPAVAAGKVENIGQLSGFALQILYGPLMERTKIKRNTYGPLVCDIASKLLEINGVVEGAKVTPVWSDPLPKDEQSETSSMESEQRMGLVSRQTLAERRGYDWDAEQERLGEERELEARDFNAL